jgi:hypothetical protein
MARAIKLKDGPKTLACSAYSFTVVFEVSKAQPGSRNGHKSRSAATGYPVSAVLLPGLLPCGRTLARARETARDAIQCHLEL